MNNFNQQLNNVPEIKTIQELAESCFSSQKSAIDLSFFYKEVNDYKKIQEMKKDRVEIFKVA